MAYGKSIELFLANGTADSLIIAELSNWNGKAIKIPRIEVADCKRDDINGAGVYFLFCKEEDDTDFVYIGESETVPPPPPHPLQGRADGAHIGAFVRKGPGPFLQQDFGIEMPAVAHQRQRPLRMRGKCRRQRQRAAYRPAKTAMPPADPVSGSR